MNQITKQTLKIIREFMPSFAPNITIVRYLNGQEFFGFFQNLPHENEHLLNKGQYGFIPNNNSEAFRKELDATGIINPIHSIIIDLTLTESIRLINPSGQVVKQLNLVH